MNIKFLKFFLSIFFLGNVVLLSAQVAGKFNLTFVNQINKSYFKYSDSFSKNPERATYNYGLEAHYNFPQKGKVNLVIGLAFQRIGHGTRNVWESGDTLLLELYGDFPITATSRDYFYYAAIPISLNIQLPNDWFLMPNLSIEYPIGIRSFSKYKNGNGEVSVRDRGPFITPAFYPENFSLGAGIQVGKIIQISEKYQLAVGAKFAGYSLLAYRAHDEYRLEDGEYPFSLGINVGVLL